MKTEPMSSLNAPYQDISLAYILRPRTVRQAPLSAQLIWTVTFVAISVSILFHLLKPATQAFSLDHQIKLVALPLIAFAVAQFLYRLSRLARIQMVAADHFVLLYCALVGPATLVGWANGNRSEFILQDAFLTIMFGAFYFAGRSTVLRYPSLALTATIPLLVTGIVAALLGSQLAPIYVGVIPAGISALFATGPKRGWYRAAGIIALAGQAGIMIRGQSLSTQYQFTVCGAVLGYYILRRGNFVGRRIAVILVPLGVLALALLTAGGTTLLSRNATPTTDDPALGAREYEAAAVRLAISDAPISGLLGTGVGGSVDLSASPDVATLRGAGRDVSAVQSVHLLPYEILLKRGYLGVLLMGGILIFVIFTAFSAFELALQFSQPALLCIALVPLVGMIDAMGAASHFFSNPLPAFYLGVLVSLGGLRSCANAQSSSVVRVAGR